MKAYKEKQLFFRHFLSAPFIYSVIIALVTMDILVEIYHRMCFPIYGLDYVRRREYIKIDRHKLSYLNWFQKINCVYCGYANGLLHYVSEIAGVTEAYWCGIQHQKSKTFHPTSHQVSFLQYGDEKDYLEFFK
ncbi:MAG: hypothetical protein ABII02_04250 [Candidatus Magasanikbacteria bacterium]